MKYRIKIVTYVNGRKGYFPQYKAKLKWVGLLYDGSYDAFSSYEKDSRESALSCIDKHFSGNTKSQTIEFEYITK